jgi:hypothetical protein
MTENEPTIEFSDEQKDYIGKVILQDRMREHRAIAGEQAYRLAYFYVLQDCNRGLYDPELANIILEEWARFKGANPILGATPPVQKENKE